MALAPRIRAGLAALALAALAVLAATVGPQRAQAQPAAVFATGAAQVANSKEGSAILSGALGPGDSVTGTVTISNPGSVTGIFSLQLSHLTDTPGPGGGFFSRELDLAVDDVTNASAPTAVYRGRLNSLGPTALGSFAPGSSRTYRFTVTWASAGAADTSFYGSKMSVEFDWLASDGVPTPPPPPPPAPVPAPQPAAPAPPAAPRLNSAVSTHQRVVEQGGVLLQGACDQACTLRASGTVSIPGASAVYRLAPVSRSLAAGKRARLKLRVRGRTLSRLRAALRAHRRPTVAVTLSAKSPTGTSTTLKRRIRVTG
jgi:spore coat-associated protein N